MIIRFPDKDFSFVTVEFDTETYTATYVYDSPHTPERRPCTLTRAGWVERLRAWRIDLPRLIAMDDYTMDEGL